MSWLRVGDPGQFPAREWKVLRLLGRPFGLRRDADGSWFALELSCRHQGADLSAGHRQGDLVVCPRHGWTYDLATGACVNEPDRPLRRVAVRERDGRIELEIPRLEPGETVD
jgi:nitrite reductase/ring-hydroxylating ferredoxin subunit